MIKLYDIPVLWIQANLNMQYFCEAADDFGAVLKLEPDNQVAKYQLSIAVKKQADGAAQERSMFAGMFHKFAQQDLSVCMLVSGIYNCTSCCSLLPKFSVTHSQCVIRFNVIL